MKTVFLFLSVLILTSCPNKEDMFSTTCNTNNPLKDLTWLKEAKENIDRIDCAGKSSITQYLYNSNTVFEVNICSNITDGQTVVYSCEGEIICKFGGISGENTCPDFYQTAVDKVILYGN
jgi:hypothetical protein